MRELDEELEAIDASVAQYLEGLGESPGEDKESSATREKQNQKNTTHCP